MGITIVSMEIKRLEEEPLPAITFCTRNWLSMKKVSNLSDFRESYTEYMENYEEYDRLYRYISNETIRVNITNIQSRMDIIYRSMKDALEDSHPDIFERVKSYSIDLNDTYFKTVARGTIRNKVKILYNNDEITLSHPVESIINDGQSILKCFTFNSFIKMGMRHFKWKLKEYLLQLKINFDIIPRLPFNYYKFFMKIHSPNSFPTLNDMGEIDAASAYSFKFSQVNTELLGKGYETNCVDYNNYTNFKMNSDCITSCILDYLDELEYFKNCKLSHNLIRYEMIANGNFHKTCNFDPYFFEEFFNVYPGIEHRCTEKCLKDCNFIYYIHTHEESKNIDLKNTFIQIIIEHNNLPDVLIKYLPRTEFISVVCQFGGLIGMWLGLSVFAICEVGLESIIMVKNRIWCKVKNIFPVHIFNDPPILINQNVINMRQRLNVNIRVR